MRYPGTPISFLPDWASDVWRGAVLIAIVVVMVRMGLRASKDKGRSRGLVYGRVALFLLLFQVGYVNAQRWGEPVTWEGLPIVTAAVVFSWVAMRDEPPS